MLAAALVAVGAACLPLRAQTAEEYAVKASFIAKFVEFVQWPNREAVNADSAGPFVISILGPDPFRGNLAAAFRNAGMGSRRVDIRVVDQVEDLTGSHLVFLSGAGKDQASKAVEWARGNGALTIGDHEGYGELGVIINFFLRNDKVRFEINTGAAERGRFQISSLLLKVARIVGPE